MDKTSPAAPDDLAQLARFIAKQERKPVLVAVPAGSKDAVQALLVPTGYELKPTKPILDAFRLQPELRAGTTVLTDLESFIAWTNRHKDDDSVVYANDDMIAPSLTAIIDHDRAGAETVRNARARFGRHRATYSFPLSREWQAWSKVSGDAMSAVEFASFFEQRIGDVMPPPYGVDGKGEDVLNTQDPEIRKLAVTLAKKFATPGDIVRLTRGIEINSESKATQKIDRDTGEVTLEYQDSNDGGSPDRVKPPNAFLIAIPVLANGTPILMAVHLRYRASGGKVVWIIELHQPDRVFEEVFRQSLAKVAEDTAIVPLRGKAPAAR